MPHPAFECRLPTARFFAPGFGAGLDEMGGGCRRCRGAFTSQPSSTSFFERATGALGDLAPLPSAALPCPEDAVRLFAADPRDEGLSMCKGSGALPGDGTGRRGAAVQCVGERENRKKG